MRYIGVVDFVAPAKKGPPFARVVPLASVGELELNPVSADVFTPQGKVFWASAKEATANALVFFRAEENSGSGHKDDYKVVDPELAMEVIDLRRLSSAEGVRLALAEGLSDSHLPLSRVFLWCKEMEEVVVGPVRLIQRPDGLVTFDYPSRHKIPFYPPAAVDIRSVSHGSRTRHVSMASSIGAPVGFVDWDEDRLAIRRAITWAVDFAAQRAGDHKLASSLLNDAAQALASEPRTAEVYLERYRVERAFGKLMAANAARELLELVTSELSRLPAIAQALDRARQEAREAAREEIERELQGAREEAAAARKERDTVREEAEAARAQLESSRAQLDAQLKSVEEELTRRVREVLERPAALLAEAALLRVVMAPPANTGAVPLAPSQRAAGRSPLSWAPAPRSLGEVQQLREVLRASFKASGLSPLAGLRIHAALSAGLLPVVAGPYASQALEAYARVVCGGRLLRLHATPALLEPTDLLGRADPSGERLLHHPAGLLYALREARQEHRLALIAIEGANRGPTEAYLLPLLQSIASGAPLHLPVARAEEDGALTWPEGVLLAATVVEGPTALPVSSELWASAVVVVANCGLSRGAMPEPTEIPIAGSLLRPAAAPEGFVEELREHLAEYYSFWPALERFVAGMASFFSSPGDLRQAILECCVLPLLVSLEEDDEREDALRTVCQVLEGEEERQNLRALARQLRRIVG